MLVAMAVLRMRRWRLCHFIFRIKVDFRPRFGLNLGLKLSNPKDKVTLEFGIKLSLRLVSSSKTESKPGFSPKLI